MEHVTRKIKRYAIGLLAMLTVTTIAGDLTRSVTFTDGQRITAAQLHTLVDGASVNATFLTGKDLLGAVDSSDYVLTYDTSAGVFKRMTLGTLVMNNTDLITTQSDEPVPASDDYLLLYNTSGTSLTKLSIANLTLNNTNFVRSMPLITNLVPSLNPSLWVTHNGTNNQIAVTNLWLAFTYRAPFTNLVEHTTPTNTDKLLIWDSTANTNKWITFSGMVSNLPTATAVYSTNVFLVQSNGIGYQVSYTTLANSISNTINSGSTYTGSNALPALAATQTFTHPLAGMPQAVRVVAYFISDDAANSGYTTGDEIDIDGINAAPSLSYPTFTVKTSSSSIAVRRNFTSCLISKNGTAYSVESKIALKVYAIYRP